MVWLWLQEAKSIRRDHGGREAGITAPVNFKTLRLFHLEAVGSIDGLGSLVRRSNVGSRQARR